MDLLDLGKIHGIVGESQKLLKVLQLIIKFRDLDATVLICGESGTGKELVARALHFGSVRGSRPYRAVNCGAFPSQLLESELFGYRKGAFTDAKSDRPGLFEVCHTGTLFLDEIGELSLPLQVKFLRVLQDKEFTPLGATTPMRVDVRVIAATNRDLAEEVEKGRFRADLFHRLSVLQVPIAPLRERIEDIPLLVGAFLRSFNERYGKNVNFPNLEFLSRLMLYSWPGNVRELKNVLERAVILSEGDHLQMVQLSEAAAHSPDPGSLNTKLAQLAPSARFMALNLDHSESLEPLDSLRDQLERGYLRAALRVSRGNIAEVARLSGCHRTEIYRMLRRHLLDPEEFRGTARG